MNTQGSIGRRWQNAVARVKALRDIIQRWAEDDIRQKRELEAVGGPLCKINLKEREKHYAHEWNSTLKYLREQHGEDAIAYALVVLDLTHFGK